MPWIGIEKDTGLFYEGSFRFGHAVLPVPVTTPAALIAEKDLPPKLPPSYGLEQSRLIFREDTFDSVTRIRRGRLYVGADVRTDTWEVFPHPYRITEAGKAKQGPGTLSRPLVTYQSWQLVNELEDIRRAGAQPLIATGTQGGMAIWSIVSLEGTSTGEYLFTLRARDNLGALPVIRLDAIPPRSQATVLEYLDKLRQDMHRAGASSVVDRAREAAAAILNAYLLELGVADPGEDLNELVKKTNGLQGQNRRRIAASAAEIVRLLHSRAKHSIQEAMPVDSVRDQDGQLAVACVAAILCELRWADWP